MYLLINSRLTRMVSIRSHIVHCRPRDYRLTIWTRARSDWSIKKPKSQFLYMARKTGFLTQMNISSFMARKLPQNIPTPTSTGSVGGVKTVCAWRLWMERCMMPHLPFLLEPPCILKRITAILIKHHLDHSMTIGIGPYLMVIVFQFHKILRLN